MNENKDINIDEVEEVEEVEEIITITLDDDSELDCHVLLTFDIEDKDYIALLPVDSDEVYLYSYEEMEDGELELANIEDEEEFQKAADEFYSQLGIEDDECCGDEDCDCESSDDCDCSHH
jgi:uncharacterized protein YrzB (UPF0473 family)